MSQHKLDKSKYSLENIRDAFLSQHVSPDVIPLPPNTKLNVIYRNGITVELGNCINIENVETNPTIDLSAFDEKAYYALIMTDPDMPSRKFPTDREYLLWLVLNITKNDIRTGESIAAYEAPFSRHDSGLHRYVFVLLEQFGPIVFDMSDLVKRNEDKTKITVVEHTVNCLTEQGNRCEVIQSKTEYSETGCSERDNTNEKTQLMHEQISDDASSSDSDGGKTIIGFEDQRYRLPNAAPISTALLSKRGVEDGHGDGIKSDKIFDAVPAKSASSPVDNFKEKIQRYGFSTKAFMTKYMIRGIVAGNFFQAAQFNDLSDTKKSNILQKKLCAASALQKNVPADNGAFSPVPPAKARAQTACTSSVPTHASLFIKMEKQLERTAISKK